MDDPGFDSLQGQEILSYPETFITLPFGEDRRMSLFGLAMVRYKPYVMVCTEYNYRPRLCTVRYCQSVANKEANHYLECGPPL
jgi:hypothetical protein